LPKGKFGRSLSSVHTQVNKHHVQGEVGLASLLIPISLR
jgi:hypothetical protein